MHGVPFPKIHPLDLCVVFTDVCALVERVQILRLVHGYRGWEINSVQYTAHLLLGGIRHGGALGIRFPKLLPLGLDRLQHRAVGIRDIPHGLDRFGL